MLAEVTGGGAFFLGRVPLASTLYIGRIFQRHTVTQIRARRVFHRACQRCPLATPGPAGARTAVAVSRGGIGGLRNGVKIMAKVPTPAALAFRGGLAFSRGIRPAGRVGRCGCGTMAAKHVSARLVVAAKLQQPTFLRVFEQVAEGAKAVVAFAEIGFAAFDGFLEDRRPDLAGVSALGDQGLERFHGQLDTLQAARVLCFAAVALFFGAATRRGRIVVAGALPARQCTLVLAHQIVVKNEFVAVGNQQIRGRLLDPHTDDLLGVFAQLGDQGREV